MPTTSMESAGGAPATEDLSEVKLPPNNIPSRDPKFTGRDEELREIHQLLADHATVGITQRMSPHSQGGMGKTALAIAYAWKHLRDYPGGVFFVHATGAPWLTKIAALADSLSIEHNINEKKSAVAVRDRLAQGKPTLVILDGADDRNDWDPVQWAAPEPCRCIVTTNRPVLDGVEMYQIDGLSTDQGIQMLIEYRADAAERQHLPNAREVVEVFAGFPMGLTIVGSYMQLNPNTNWQTCRALVRGVLAGTVEQDRRLRGRRQNVPDFVSAIHTLFDSVLSSLTTQQRLCMEFAAMLPDNHIVLKWLFELLQTKDAATASKLLGGTIQTEQQVATVLLSMQLLRVTAPRCDVLGMAKTLRDRLRQHFREDNVQITNTVELLSSLAKKRVADLLHASPDKAMRAQVTWVVELVKELRAHGCFADGAVMAKDLALLLHRLGRYHEAIALLDSYLDEETAEKLEPTLVAILLSNKAVTLAAVGRADDGRRLMERAIQIDHKHLPSKHPTLASHYSNFAGILRQLGELRKARRFIVQAIEIEQKQFGDDYAPLGLRHWWLGEIDLAEGEDDSALAQFQCAFEIMSKHFPSNHKEIRTLVKKIQRLEEPANSASPVTK